MASNALNVSLGRFDRRKNFILIVDSEPEYCHYTSMVLQRLGYTTHTERSIAEALELSTIKLPSLVLTALKLKDGDGLHLIRQFKKSQLTTRIPFIALRKSTDICKESECFTSGAIDCLCSPAPVELLYRAVQNALESVPRKNIRIRTYLPIKADNIKPGYLDGACVMDLSEQGMFVRMQKPFSIDTHIAAQVHIFPQVVRTDSVVIYSTENENGPYYQPGMGVKFVRIAAQDQETIRAYIKNEVMRGIPLPQ